MSLRIRMTATEKVPNDVFDELEGFLAVSKPIPDAGIGETIWTTTVRFPLDYEMGIKVVNSEEGPWTEGVLFLNGEEVGMTDVGESLEGEYTIVDDANNLETCTFTVMIERSDTE